MTDTDTGKWEEMVLKGAQFLIEHSGGTWGSTPPHHKDWALAESEGTLQAAGVKALVSIRDAVVEAAMPDHPKPGQFSWQLSKLREAYDAALSDNGRG